jgi:murein L,D-transpeptidase YcbB/YkuD
MGLSLKPQVLLGAITAILLQQTALAQALGSTEISTSIDIQTMPLGPSKSSSEISPLQHYVDQGLFIRIGNHLVDLPDIREFYKLRNYRSIWISDGRLNEFAATFRDYVSTLNRHGLNPKEYWTPMVEASYQNFSTQASQTSMVRIELLMTEALLKVANHLANGRFDPNQIDSDIKFRHKTFMMMDTMALDLALNEDGAKLVSTLESLTPQFNLYKELVDVLGELRARKLQDTGYLKLSSPGFKLNPGDTHPDIPKLRQALRDRGYPTRNSSNIYDQDLVNSVMSFQAENGLEVSPNIGSTSEFWRVLSFSLDQRIRQTEVNLEKLRWLPRFLEPRYIFVNTAFTELKVIEKELPVLEMKTVNGRPLWRTPTMRDLISAVVLNPTWTATDSIVTQIKLPEILKDIGYLEKNRIHLKDRATGEIIDPTSIDWKREGVDITKKVLFVQDPGPNNALGVVKFSLTINRDDIYMHDTNERNLFANGMRQRSSGCVRLEKPIELANYLLSGSEYNAEQINELIAKGTPDEVYETNLRINLPKDQWVPVYTIYQTVERAQSGRIRFATDYYGQDSRVSSAINQSSEKQDRK